jgi:CheY-like chemotaxis protein
MAPHRPLVLVVEDEFVVRLVAVHALVEAGFEVIEAEHAREAIGLLKGGAAPHLLFTDVHMPGAMNGIALAAHVFATRPTVKVIITSALPMPTDLDHLGASFLPKPYGLSDLCGLAQDLVGQAPRDA